MTAMRTLGIAAVAWLMLVSVSACSNPPALPDRSTPAVKAEEARLATLLGADPSIIGVPSTCQVRLLGQETGASFVWALCEGPGPSSVGAGISAPMRVVGTNVTTPQDGAAFGDSVRTMFPEDLAEFVLKNAGTPAVLP
jgi:hypothetical protein